MAEEKNNQYFSVENGELLYLGVPLPETGIIKESHTLLEKLMLPGKALNGDDKEYAKRLCWLSYIFCIASQGIDYAMREMLIRTKYLKGKTSSFWNLCLGGRKLLTLDVHNLRQLAGLGIN